MQLLTINNPKTLKGEAAGYMTAVLHLAPYSTAGVNVCPMAEVAGCVKACLNMAGRGGLAANNATIAPYGVEVADNAIQRARINRTRFYVEDRDTFMAQLVAEITLFVIKAKRDGYKPAIRLNGTSDIRWEDIPVNGRANIFECFPTVQFYDYTKIPNRRYAHIPNYTLAFSWSGVAGWSKYAERAIANGMNIVAVFRDKLPEYFLGMRVVDGDASDLRFLDPVGVCVGLKAKGKARKDTSGFVVDL